MKKLLYCSGGIIFLILIGMIISQIVYAQPIPPYAMTFLVLWDTPSTYSGQAGKYVKVNATNNGLEFGTFGEDSIGATELKDTDSPSDEDIYTYESTGSTGEWHTIDELVGTISEGALADSSVISADIKDDTIDSADYVAGSIDAEHLAADIIDETKIADNGIDSEHYNNGSIDLVHLASGVYAKDIVTTSPITGGTDNVLVGADGDVTIAVTVAKDIVTTAPLTGAVDNVIIGTDADITLGIDVLKDLVTTAPVTGGTDNILPGSDSDITVALDFTASWDFGGAAGFELPNAGAPTTDATGEIALDTTITDHQPLYQYYDGGENMTLIGIDTSQLPAEDNEIVKYDAGTDKFVLEADASAGTTAWDDISDPDAAATVDFVTYTQTIDIGKSDSGGGDGLVLDVTGLGAGGDKVRALKITTAADDDTSYRPIQIHDDSGVLNDLLFMIDYTGSVTSAGTITSSGGSVVIGSTNQDGTLVIHDDDVGGDATVTIQAVDATGTSYTITLPPDDGDAGEQLQTNGAGVTTWEAAGGAGATAWDDIGNPDAASVIDFGTNISQLDVNDLRVGAVDDGNYMKIAGNAVTFVGTGDIDLPDDSVEDADINWVGLTDLAAGGVLSGDCVDESHIADDGIDSEHYNNGSIDLVHLASGVYAKDIVTTSPITGGTDNVLVGADGDLTLALDFTASWDYGGAAGFELPNAGAPTTDAAGEIALDTTITDHQPLWQYYDGGENMTVIGIDTAQLPAEDNEIVKYDAGTDKFVLEADVSGGTTPWDSIGDPTSVATVDFTTYTQTIDIGVTDTGGPKSGLILDVTGLGAGVTDVIALEITTATNDDTDYIPIAVYDDSGADNDLLFKINSLGYLYIGASQGILAVANNQFQFSENADSIYFNFNSGSDCDVIWSDGVLNLRNQEDGIDAIVEIEGKDAGEKGILRVLSDGDDKYIELHHDDTDANIISNSGDIYITPAGGDVNLTDSNLTTTGTATFAGGTLTGTINASGSTLTMPKRTSNDDKRFSFNAWNPNALYDTDTQICFEPNLPAAITITEVTVSLDADPTTELDWDLKFADAFIGLANATLIVAIDTTSGTTDIDSGFNDATVPAGKCLYVEFAADPDSNIKQAIVKIRYDYD